MEIDPAKMPLHCAKDDILCAAANRLSKMDSRIRGAFTERYGWALHTFVCNVPDGFLGFLRSRDCSRVLTVSL